MSRLERKLDVPGEPIRNSVFHQFPQHRKFISPGCWAAPLATVSLMESLQKAVFNRELPRWPMETERTTCIQKHCREQDGSQIHVLPRPHVITGLHTHPRHSFTPSSLGVPLLRSSRFYWIVQRPWVAQAVLGRRIQEGREEINHHFHRDSESWFRSATFRHVSKLGNKSPGDMG